MNRMSVLPAMNRADATRASPASDDLAPAAGVLVAAAFGTIIWAGLIAAFLAG
jgi:hypothetical protein